MRNHMAAGWFYSPEQIQRYFLSRVTSLKPPMKKMRSPWVVLRDLNRHQWLMFWVGFAGWTWDAFDFFTVSLTITELSEEFNEINSAVSWGITITLMLRSVGALIFGLVADRYGRKWPMIINLGLFVILELGSGFCTTLSQFIGVRSLYGIAMGGLFGPAAATALEDMPYEARGILSGLFEQGYAIGYLLAAIFYRAFVPTTTHGWRSLFWFGAGPPILIMIWRYYLPETHHFEAMKAEREARIEQEAAEGDTSAKASGLRAFLREARSGIGANWVLCIYLIVIMTGYNSCSHGSQDFYPTFLKDQVGMSPTQTTVITVIGQIGALVGGTLGGYFSTFLGRRLTMMLACVVGAAIVPAYVLPRDMSLIASAFFLQFFVGGVWGPIPIHLTELSPPALRGLLVGLTYQLGNLASSASATIQSVIGERFPLADSADGEKRFDYGKVIGIFMGAVWVYVLLFLFFGPEMSQEERNAEEEASNQLFELQREGKSFVQIGRERALANKKDDSGEEKKDDSEKQDAPSTQHLDIESGGEKK